MADKGFEDKIEDVIETINTNPKHNQHFVNDTVRESDVHMSNSFKEKQQQTEGLSNPYDAKNLQHTLEDWKFVLLPLNNLLEWERKFDPLLIILANTLLFGLLFIYNPSILTTISIIGLSFLIFESFVPLVTSYFFKASEWGPESQAQYIRICQRISNFCAHALNAKNKLELMRRDQRTLYFFVVLFFLVFCAYVGQNVDNFLLTYLGLLIVTLTPGARRHKLVPKAIESIKNTLGIGKQTNKND